MPSSRPALSAFFLSLAAITGACVARGEVVEEVRILPSELDESELQAEESPAEAPQRQPLSAREEGAFYVLGPDATHPRVRFLDGQTSLNQSCAIQLGNKLNRRVPPMYVNGQPIGFC